MVIGGIDIGSTGAKITVMDADGTLLHKGYRDYPVSRRMDAHELHAPDVWEVVQTLLREAAQAAPELAAVGVISFGESFAMMDEDDQVLLPAMLYTDPRGEEEAAMLRDALGNARIGSIAGTEAHPMFSLPKLMWIKKHRPQLYARARRVCLMQDYLVYKLTGQRIIDYSLASRVMGFDIRAKTWSREIFDAAGIDPALLSTPVPSGTSAGPVLPQVAEALGLRKDLQVVAACHDQAASALGSGVMAEGSAADGGGTVQCMTPVFRTQPDSAFMERDHFAMVPFLREDTYCCYAFSFTGGALVQWFVDGFAAPYRAEAEALGKTVYRHMEEQMADEPSGILALPHFAGAGTPYMDTGSKGAFVGLDLAHTPVDLFRAIMEGISYEMRVNLERLEQSGIPIRELKATGGCAKSKLWLQMKADILGLPVTRMGVDEAGTIGGIMLTGVATGVYPDLEHAAHTLIRSLEVYRPRPEMSARYEPHYQRYKRLYDAVRPLV